MTEDNRDMNDRMIYVYENYTVRISGAGGANAQRIKIPSTTIKVPSTTYDKIMALLSEMEEAGNSRAKELRSEMSWTRRVTGAD